VLTINAISDICRGLSATVRRESISLNHRESLSQPAIELKDLISIDGLDFLRDYCLRWGKVIFRSPINGCDLAGNLSLHCPQSQFQTLPLTGYIVGVDGQHLWAIVTAGMDRCVVAGVVDLVSCKAYVDGDLSKLPNKPGGFIITWYNWYINASPAIRRLAPLDEVRILALPLINSHFAHHIWNELTLVDRIEGLPVRSGQKVTYLARTEPLGSLENLFPEISSSRIERQTQPPKPTPFEAFYERLNMGDTFSVPSGYLSMSAEFISHLYGRLAATDTTSQLEADKFRSSHYPVLLVTIRPQHRTMVNFKSVLSELINKLSNSFPFLGVVFDGTSLPPWVSPQHNELAEEKSIVAEIQAAIPSTVGTRSVIGESFASSFVWSRHADCYLSHHGSLQHKAAWLSSIPGVVHVGDNKRGLTDGFLKRTSPETIPFPIYVFFPVSGQPSSMDGRTDLIDYIGGAKPLIDAVMRVLGEVPQRFARKSPPRMLGTNSIATLANVFVADH